MLCLPPRALGLSAEMLKRSMDLVDLRRSGSCCSARSSSWPRSRSSSTAPARCSSGSLGSGEAGREFSIVKFRTMVRDAEELKKTVDAPEQARRRRSAHVQGSERPARHPRRADPAPDLDRRAAAALERPARRDEPRRPAAADPGRGGARLRLGRAPPRPEAWHHRPLAGAGCAATSRSRRWSGSTTCTSPTGRCGTTCA